MQLLDQFPVLVMIICLPNHDLTINLVQLFHNGFSQTLILSLREDSQ